MGHLQEGEDVLLAQLRKLVCEADGTYDELTLGAIVYAKKLFGDEAIGELKIPKFFWHRVRSLASKRLESGLWQSLTFLCWAQEANESLLAGLDLNKVRKKAEFKVAVAADSAVKNVAIREILLIRKVFPGISFEREWRKEEFRKVARSALHLFRRAYYLEDSAEILIWTEELFPSLIIDLPRAKRLIQGRGKFLRKAKRIPEGEHPIFRLALLWWHQELERLSQKL